MTDVEMVQAEIARLLGLSEAATPGPWISQIDPSDGRGPDKADWIIGSPERVVIREDRPWFWNDPPRKDEADLALCAEYRNCAPPLLRLLAAAIELQDSRGAWDAAEVDEATECFVRNENAQIAYDAALAAAVAAIKETR